MALAAAILHTVRSQNTNNNANGILPTTTAAPIPEKNLVDTVNVTQLMLHAQELQGIADKNGKTRLVGTPGFDATLAYIESQLRSKTNFIVFRQDFPAPERMNNSPALVSSIQGVDKTYIYRKDFFKVTLSPAANFSTSIRLTEVPNGGCDDSDWLGATPHLATDSVAIVAHDKKCSMTKMSTVAQKYSIAGLLIFDRIADATDPDDAFVARNTTFPALFLSHALGMQLTDATRNPLLPKPSVRIAIPIYDTVIVSIPSTNLCADTPTGNRTETIIIGSHSDSVADGPGLNDNGSGAMGVLLLALNLAHLFQNTSYEAYRYRIRFCWWGAEERGLSGSFYYVNQSRSASTEGNRLKDHILALNFDMIASPNFYFGIHEGSLLPDEVPSAAKGASSRISQVFQNWFDQEKLPWDNSSLLVRSDHIPFIFEGVPSGGLFSGSDESKTLEQRDRYGRMLGDGHGGVADTVFDPCYHRACDTIENLNPFCFKTMVKSAGYTLETLARKTDLRSWLYSP